MVHKNTLIELHVLSIQPEEEGYLTIAFERPIDFTYDSGDWIDIAFPGQQLKGGKTYSLSSSPTEAEMRITFREGLSPLKKAMAAVKAGDKLIITQYGNDYGFSLNQNKRSTLVAGGVGIAPFRSMLKEMYDTRSDNSVTLLYLHQSSDFIFHNDIDRWVKSLRNVNVQYIATKELNRKKREKLITSIVTDVAQSFYIAGPPGMVESTTRLLGDLGVHVRDIKTDIFGGY